MADNGSGITAKRLYNKPGIIPILTKAIINEWMIKNTIAVIKIRLETLALLRSDKNN